MGDGGQPNGKFPSKLLTEPISAQLQYFKNYMTGHPYQALVARKVIRVTDEPAGVSLVFVIGSTGVGKTTVRLRTEQHLLASAHCVDPGTVPFLSVEAMAAGAGVYDYGPHYDGVLRAIDEPLINRKVLYDGNHLEQVKNGRLMARRSVSLSIRRWAAINAVRHRQPRILMIDDAQHMGRVASGRRLQDQLDHIKSDASLMKVPHVLFGTFDLLDLLNLSGQLSRRALIIYYPRYQMGRLGHSRAVQRIILSLQRQMPFAVEPDLVAHWKYIFEWSAGLVGIMKDWFTRSCASALSERARTLTLGHLRRHALAPSQLERILVECRNGEERIAESLYRHRHQRGIVAPDQAVVSQSPKTTRSKRGRVGRPKARRHPVGVARVS